VRRVAAAFDLAVAEHVAKRGESRVFTRHEKRAARAYQWLMRRHIKAQSAALIEQLRQGLTEEP